jgi:hypothetical protein
MLYNVGRTVSVLNLYILHHNIMYLIQVIVQLLYVIRALGIEVCLSNSPQPRVKVHSRVWPRERAYFVTIHLCEFLILCCKRVSLLITNCTC